jgi:hypothetical protein
MKELNKKIGTVINGNIVISWITEEQWIDGLLEEVKIFTDLTESEIKELSFWVKMKEKSGVLFSNDRTNGTKLNWEVI